MTVFIEVISDWFNKSVFGHQKELGLKQDSFTENEMIFFGLICANKQREISEQEYLEGYAIALSRKVKQIKEEYAKKSCELLCKTCNIGVLEKDGSLKDAIIITKEALEKLRDEYIRKCKFEHKHDLELASFADSVRAEILNDILKHFDDEV